MGGDFPVETQSGDFSTPADKCEEDPMFKDCIEEFPIPIRNDGRVPLDELLPRFKIVCDMRQRDLKSKLSAFDMGEWSYVEEYKTWDLVQRLCNAQSEDRRAFESRVGVTDITPLQNDAETLQRQKYWGAVGGEQVLPIGHPLVQESELLIARRIVETVADPTMGELPGQSIYWMKAVIDWLEANVEQEKLYKVKFWAEHNSSSEHADPDLPEDSKKEQHFMYALWMLCRTGYVGWMKQLDYEGKPKRPQVHEEEWSTCKAVQELQSQGVPEPSPEQIQEKQTELKGALDYYITRLWKEMCIGRLNSDEQDDITVAEILCRCWGRTWRAATLLGGHFYHDPVLCGWALPSNTGSPQQRARLAETGCLRRQLWKEMCIGLAQQQSLKVQQTPQDGTMSLVQPKGPSNQVAYHSPDRTASDYEQALYAVLGGDAVLAEESRVLEDWNDKFWVHVKVAFDKIVEHRVQREATPSPLQGPSEASSSLQTEDVATTLANIVMQLQPSKDMDQAMMQHPLRFVQQLLLLGDLENLLDILCRLVTAAQKYPWHSRLLRFAVHLMLLLRSCEQAPYEMNKLEGEEVLSPQMSQTGKLRLPSWTTSTRCTDAQLEKNAGHCDRLLYLYAEHLGRSGQEDLAPSYIARLAQPAHQVTALLMLYTIMEESPHLAQELSVLHDRSIHCKQIELQFRAFENHRYQGCPPQEPDEYILRIIMEATEQFAKKDPFCPRNIKWLCTIAIAAAGGHPHKAALYMSKPVKIAVDLLRQLLGSDSPRDTWMPPHVEQAIQLVACLPQEVRNWGRHPEESENEEGHQNAMELYFWCEWVYGWERCMRTEHARAQRQRVLQLGNSVLQHTLNEGLPEDAVETEALGAVRHLVEALRNVPLPARLQQQYGQLLQNLVPATVHQVLDLLINVLAEAYLRKNEVVKAIHMLEEALQMAPLLADRARCTQGPLFELIGQQAMQKIVRQLATAEVKLLQTLDQHKGWANGAAKLRREREEDTRKTNLQVL